MPECGSQCWLCDLPIRFDTYKGCSHGCKYCFVQRKSGMEVSPHESARQLAAFIAGKRNGETRWADWNIPIHWGGMSDPFQPCERTQKRTLEALKVLKETGYPCVISTKGRLCVEEPYFSLIAQSNIVMQVSAVCGKYDALEPCAPPYEERLEMMRKLSKAAKRVIVRAQPYICDVFNDVRENIPRIAEAGAHGIIFEGMKFNRKKPGTVKCGGDFMIPVQYLKRDFERLKEECHKNGLAFYSGENRLRAMGDSLTCCGIDGLEGFRPNTYNLAHILNGDKVSPGGDDRKGNGDTVSDGLSDGGLLSEGNQGEHVRGCNEVDGHGKGDVCFGCSGDKGTMTNKGTASAFGHIFQEAAYDAMFREMSFQQGLAWLYKNRKSYVCEVLNVKG